MSERPEPPPRRGPSPASAPSHSPDDPADGGEGRGAREAPSSPPTAGRRGAKRKGRPSESDGGTGRLASLRQAAAGADEVASELEQIQDPWPKRSVPTLIRLDQAEALRPGSEASPRTDLIKELVSKCLQARDMAYCPYSHFPVGAALLTAGGAIVTGCNVENASFGLTQCAERVAVQRAVVEGHRRFTAIAVTCDIEDSFVGPCGACRQVLMEFGADWAVFLTKPDGSYRETSLRELLPLAFSPEHLAKK